MQTRNGYTAVGARGAVSAGGVTRAGAVAGIRGPYGGTVAAGRGAAFVNGQFVGGAAWGAVNGNFRGWGLHGRLVGPLSGRMVAWQMGRGRDRLGHRLVGHRR